MYSNVRNKFRLAKKEITTIASKVSGQANFTLDQEGIMKNRIHPDRKYIWFLLQY